MVGAGRLAADSHRTIEVAAYSFEAHTVILSHMGAESRGRGTFVGVSMAHCTGRTLGL